jgi:succinate dehydrogenase / fumarate reductase, cytochrome b subunit
MTSTIQPEKWHFYLRRLHSLTGVVPVGIFLIQHMYANSLALWGPEVYDSHVHLLLEQPLLIVLEIAFVFAPLAFHAILGVYFMMDSRWNPHRYAYARNWLYTAQRVTAWITLVYVIVHVAQTRFSFSDDQKWEMYSSMQALFQANPVWLPIFYAIGVVAASFHLCNGLWAFCIVWGITVRRKTQQVVWYLCMGLFVLLSMAGILALLPLSGAIDPFFYTAD